MRKYFTEFGINVSTAFKTIVPVEHLDEIKDSHKYHIYFILSCDKIFIDSDSIIQSKEGIFLKLYKILDGEKTYFPDSNFAVHDSIDHSKIKIRCKYPFTILNIEMEDGEILPIDAQIIYSIQNVCQQWIFNVLYIGQSYGKDGNRLAQDRLQSHSTLQKVLTDCNSKYPDKRIYIFLLELNPILNTTMDGINKTYSANEKEDELHFNNIFKNPLKMNQIVNITEAALINYFKPIYNINFIDNFPDNNHKGYSQYYELDYNSLTVELDLEFEYPYPDVQLYTETNCIKSSWDFIQYELYNDPNRSSMYEIFKKKNK